MFRRLINGFTDLVYPRQCLACKTKLDNASVDKLICANCWSKIKRNMPPFCSSCGRGLEAKNLTKNICPACVKRPLNFDRAFSPCVYEGVIKELVHEFKYKGKDYLAQPLSRLMIEFIREYNLPLDYLDCVVPVPLHKTRLREREFNQAEVLSKCIAREFKKEVLNNSLMRQRYTKTQTELEPAERLLNVRKSFSVVDKKMIEGKNILLIDDVMTTGATLSESAYALKDAGARIVFALTLAN